MIYAPIEDTALQQHLDKLEKDELHIFTADDGLSAEDFSTVRGT